MIGLRKIHNCECSSCVLKRWRQMNSERKKLGLCKLQKPNVVDRRQFNIGVKSKPTCNCNYCAYRRRHTARQRTKRKAQVVAV